MARWSRWTVVIAGLAVAGCGEHRGPVASTCTSGGEQILSTLRRAPAHASLPDGTRLSECVSHAISDAQLQNVGSSFIAAGDELVRRAPTDDGAAFQLGYLAGAAERGASETEGIARELVDRLDRFAGDGELSPPRRAAFDRGRAAGRKRG
jgi:hypothetical protein